jgi:hypothetical protein
MELVSPKNFLHIVELVLNVSNSISIILLVINAFSSLGHNSRIFLIKLNKNKTPWLFSPKANYTDRATAACRRI